jgi:hypothetical protein
VALTQGTVPMSASADLEELFRRLALGDTTYLDQRTLDRSTTRGDRRLDATGEALLRIGALASSDGSTSSWQHAISDGRDAGLTTDQLVDAVLVLAPVIGAHKTCAIAPKVAAALGIDIEAMFEPEIERPVPRIDHRGVRATTHLQPVPYPTDRRPG